MTESIWRFHMKLIKTGTSRQWVCVGRVGRYFYSIQYSLIFMTVYYFHNKKTNKNKKEKRAILNTQASPASPCCCQPSPAQPSPPSSAEPPDTSQGTHLSRARPPLARELSSCGARASHWTAQEGVPPASGCCLEPKEMCHPHKACGCGLPHPLCWKERPTP